MGVLVLAIGLVVPSLIAAPGSDTDYRATLNEGETADSGDDLRVTLDVVDQGNDTVTVTLTDAETNESNTTPVAEGQNETVTISEETVTVTLRSIDDPSTASLTVSYSPMFGWAEPAKTLALNLDTLLAALSFITVVGLLLRVMA